MNAAHQLQPAAAEIVGFASAGERELLARWQANDPAAWREIMESHRGRMMSIAMRILHCHEDAEEVVLDAFRAAHRSLANFRGASAFRTWLTRIVYNAALNRFHYWRRRRRGDHASLNASPDPAAPSLQLGDALADPGQNTALALEVAELERAILAVLPRLDARDRALIVRRMAGVSYADLAAADGVPFGTVKSSIARARVKLRRKLGEKSLL